MDNKEAIKELKDIYDCLNVKNFEERATLLETYSRVMQVASENTEVNMLVTGRIVTSDDLYCVLRDKVENVDDVQQCLFEVRETTMMSNPKICLHYVDEHGYVKDLQTEVLGFLIELILDLAGL